MLFKSVVHSLNLQCLLLSATRLRIKLWILLESCLSSWVKTPSSGLQRFLNKLSLITPPSRRNRRDLNNFFDESEILEQKFESGIKNNSSLSL